MGLVRAAPRAEPPSIPYRDLYITDVAGRLARSSQPRLNTPRDSLDQPRTRYRSCSGIRASRGNQPWAARLHRGWLGARKRNTPGLPTFSGDSEHVRGAPVTTTDQSARLVIRASPVRALLAYSPPQYPTGTPATPNRQTASNKCESRYAPVDAIGPPFAITSSHLVRKSLRARCRPPR